KAPKRSLLLPVGAVALTAVLAIIGTLVATRRGDAGTSSPETAAASASTAASTSGPAGPAPVASADRNAIPPPPDPDDITVEQAAPSPVAASAKTGTHVTRAGSTRTAGKPGGT